MPAEIDVAVERIGTYPEDVGDITTSLTGRQQDALDAALELGYYDVPRRTTHRDIAERMGLSAGTVGEHLQKIESRVFGRLVD